MHRRIRRLALIGFITFVAISTALHFTVGSAVATFFPKWQYETPPEQAISIISLSHNVREEPPAPTPTPTAPPKIVHRTSTRIAPLQYKEMSGAQRAMLASIRPPARRTEHLYIAGPKRPKPGVQDAPAASNQVEPTPSPGTAGAQKDTGGANDVSSASVWGDDNPPRVLQAAPLAIASAPPKPIRVAVEVGPDGNVISVRIVESSGDPALDAAALDAARKTVYAPATLNGLPVHGSVVVEFPPTTSM